MILRCSEQWCFGKYMNSSIGKLDLVKVANVHPPLFLQDIISRSLRKFSLRCEHEFFRSTLAERRILMKRSVDTDSFVRCSWLSRTWGTSPEAAI